MVNVLKYEDLSIIEQFFREKGYDNGSIEVVMHLKTQERLNKLNQEYFLLNNKGGINHDNDKRDVSELIVNIGNITFKYDTLEEKEKDVENN